MNKTPALLILGGLLSFAIACQTPPPSEETTTVPIQTLPTQPQSNSVLQSESQVPRIGVSEAKAAVDSGQAILVDVRRVDSYNNSHAEGAVSIPLERFESNIAGIPLEKSRWIITYCT